MTHDPPVGSITGQNDWEWNRWQAESRDSFTELSGRPPQGSDDNQIRTSPGEIAALRRTVQQAEAELERRKQRHQYVITHYERLLAEKNRRLNRSNPETSDRLSVLSLLRRMFADP